MQKAVFPKVFTFFFLCHMGVSSPLTTVWLRVEMGVRPLFLPPDSPPFVQRSESAPTKRNMITPRAMIPFSRGEIWWMRAFCMERVSRCVEPYLF